MKLLIVWAVLSVCVAVSLASPLKTQLRDEADSSLSSAESTELKIAKNDSSSSEEEKEEEDKEQHILVKDNSSAPSDEQSDNNEIVKEEDDENRSVAQQELADDFVISRAKREVVYAPHANNQLSVKDEGTLKYEKYLKLKRVFESSLKDLNDRNKRSADTSEEKSSEEDNKDKSHAKEVVKVKKTEAEPANTLESDTKADTNPEKKVRQVVAVRRRRNAVIPGSFEENSSEEKKAKTPAETAAAGIKPDPAKAARRKRSAEDFSQQDQGLNENEVFILSNEKQPEIENNNDDFDYNEQVFSSDKNLESQDTLLENTNSEEDYAQGCGGNRSDNSSDSSNEKNETLNDNL